MEEMTSDAMNIPALGRPFTLGMLYDARKDELFPGLKLWNQKTIEEKTSEETQETSNFEVSASDSIESKSSLLDIKASLKASFMSGLIEVGGSAKYLNDTKKFKNQSRVIFQYKATTKFKELSVTQHETLNAQQKDLIKEGLATHIVTGIRYGADAFFVFDSEKLEASNVQNIQGQMEAVIKKIPSFDVNGNVEIKLTDEEKNLTNKFSCKFYGDFILKSNPASFVEAVTTYVELPKLLREKGTNTVPLTVWLMPLTVLDPEAARAKKEISVGLVGKMQDSLEDIRKIQMRCNDSLDDTVVEDFPQIQDDLNKFQSYCDRYVSSLQTTMAKKLPSIREGEEDESSLEKLFEGRKESPFSSEKLDQWLDHKEREINVIRSCVEMMEGTKIVPNQSELDREVLAAGVDDALCFVFTSLYSADPGLDAMDHYVHSLKRSTNEVPWYYSDEVLDEMKEKAGSVHHLAKALKNSRRFRFVIAAIENKKYTGATIYHYRDGKLLTEDFSKPALHPVRNITDKRDLIWYACDLTLDPNTANGYLDLSEENKKATCGSRQHYRDHPERFDRHPQVLCKEGLTVQHYWEVELSPGSNDSVYVLAAYKGVGRKGKGRDAALGCNSISWAFGKSHSKLKPWHNGELLAAPIPPEGVNKVGVFLDHEGGTLSFYRVSLNTLRHLHTFDSSFTEPVYPGLWASKKGNYAHICPIE